VRRQKSMAEKMKCKLCGFQTVRCGMGGHFYAKHPGKDWGKDSESLGMETKEERTRRLNRK